MAYSGNMCIVVNQWFVMFSGHSEECFSFATLQHKIITTLCTSKYQGQVGSMMFMLPTVVFKHSRALLPWNCWEAYHPHPTIYPIDCGGQHHLQDLHKRPYLQRQPSSSSAEHTGLSQQQTVGSVSHVKFLKIGMLFHFDFFILSEYR